MRAIPITVAALLVLFASTCAPAGSSASTPQDPALAETSPRVRLRLSGQLEGYLEPCGCAANQLGGLARRAFKLGEDRDYDLLIEGGNTIATNTDLDVDKLMEILQVLDDSDRRYDALGVGPKDLELLDDSFLYLLDGRELTAVASDVVPKELEGLDWPLRRYYERTVGSIKVRVASLVVTAPEGYEILPPQRAWQESMEGAAPSTLRILLAHTTMDGVRSLAKLSPKPDLLVAINGAHPHPPDEPTIVDGVPLVHPGTRGRHLVDVTLTRMNGVPKITHYHAIPLTGSRTAKGAMEDPNVVQSLIQHRFQVKEAGLRESMANHLPTPTPGATYVGSEICGDCHESAYEVWQNSRHGHAWTTLEEAEGGTKYPWPITHYPDCVQCHVVGYQQKSGFINPEKTPDLKHVGCEECHGPGSIHVDAASPSAKDFVPQTIDVCLRCHTYEQTPTFTKEYDKYWKKIEHFLDKKDEENPK
ncbi:MAG: hypothetical protein KDB80_07400 [Planctomycetes bacterium]|nr:hypothetical protein [Planctomycetota bacterium]